MTIYNSQFQLDNATDPRWERLGTEELSPYDCAEIQDIADDLGLPFDDAFIKWCEIVDQDNNDCWY